MTLVLLDQDGSPQLVQRVPQGDARREHALRDLIHDNPAIMPVHDLDPSYGRLFTVARELTIPGAGFVDVVLGGRARAAGDHRVQAVAQPVDRRRSVTPAI